MIIAPRTHIACECFNGRITPLRFGVGRACHNNGDITVQRARGNGEPGCVVRIRMGTHQPGGYGAAGRGIETCAGEQFEQQNTELVDVSCRGYGLCAQLLRRCVGTRHEAARGPGALVGSVVLQQFGNAEIEQARMADCVDEQVFGLDVSMNDQRVVSVCDGLACTQEHRHARVEVRSRPRDPVLNRLAIDIFHDEIRATIGSDAAIEQVRDIRVHEPRQDLSLAPKARQHGR